MTDLKQAVYQLMNAIHDLRLEGSESTLREALANTREALAQAEPELEAQPEPVQESDAFAVVQKRLDQLAGDQELMIYRWPDGQWTIDHSNPSWSAKLGEVSGEYNCTGRTFDEAVNKLAALLPSHALPVPTND